MWNLWELSWLNQFGVPQVGVGKLKVPLDSKYICESKSLKLYLNGLSQETFKTPQNYQQVVIEDLSTTLGVTPFLEIYSLAASDAKELFKIENCDKFGRCLDSLNISMSHYLPNERLLKVKDGVTPVTSFFSNAFRSFCPVTNQPDWATVGISYSAKKTLVPASLLSYLVSFRNHRGFHEACIEKVFNALVKALNPKFLIVWGAFTRRGGLDINPVRMLNNTEFEVPRSLRQ